jgi:hypothetical protein
MTPGEAAVILSVDVDAPLDDIDRAYRAHARRAHPDLLVGASPERVVAAEAEFVRVTEARAVLHERATGSRDDRFGESFNSGSGSGSSSGNLDDAASPHAQSPYPGFDPLNPTRRPYGPYEKPLPRLVSGWLVGLWTVLMLAACVASYFVGPVPGSELDLLLRLLPLTVFSVLYASTGQRVFLGAAVVLVAVTAVMTFLLASFGSLLSIELLLVPFFGLASAGRRRRLRREADSPV